MQKTATAKLSYLRISSRKVKIVIDMIRNKPVGEALAILRLTPKAASKPVEKLLLSAIANAETNHNMDVDALYVAEIYANQGPTLKRIQPRAQGRAFRILKRTSHVTIVLKENERVVAAKEAEAAKKKAARKTTKKAETAKAADKAENVETEEKAEKTEKKSTAKKTTAAKKTSASKAKAKPEEEKPAEEVSAE